MAEPTEYEWTVYAEGENPYLNAKTAEDATAPAPIPTPSYGEEMQWNTYAEGENPYQKKPKVQEDDYGWGIIQAFKRGTEMLTALPDIAQGDHEELAGHFQRMEELGRSDEDTTKLRKIQESDGWWDTTVEIFKNPALTMQVVAESLPNMLAPAAGALAGGLAGTAVAGPPGGVAGTMTGAALGSFSTEYLHGLSSFLTEEGVNMTDGQALKAAFADEELMLRAREEARLGGIPVAIFDGLSFGLAGKIYKVAEGGSRALKMAAGVGETAMQSGAGAAGEAGKQLLTKGEITSQADVLFEAIAEIPGAIVEPVIAKMVRGRQEEQTTDSLSQQLDADLTTEEEAAILDESKPTITDALSYQASQAQGAKDRLQTQQYDQMARTTAFEKEENALVEATFEAQVRENNRISMAFMENEAERGAALERLRQAAEYRQALQEGEAAAAVEEVNAEPLPGTAVGDALVAAQAKAKTKTADTLQTEGTEVAADALTEPVKPKTPKPTKAVNMSRDSFLTTRAKLPAGKRLSQKAFGEEGLDMGQMRGGVYKGRPAFSKHPDAMTPDDVAEFLNENNYPSPNGKPWDANSALDAVTEEFEGRTPLLTATGLQTVETETAYAEELSTFEQETERRAKKGPPKVHEIEVDGTKARVTSDPSGDVEVLIGDTTTITERKKGETNADLVRAVLAAQPELATQETAPVETVEIPIGRGERATQPIPRYMWHNLRGRKPAKDGGIDAYDMPSKEGPELSRMYKDGTPEDRVVYLSQEPLGEGSVQVDMSKLDASQARFTGQAEGYAIYRGNIPTNAVAEATPVKKEGDVSNDSLAADTRTAIEDLNSGSTDNQKASARSVIKLLKKEGHAEADALQSEYNKAVKRAPVDETIDESGKPAETLDEFDAALEQAATNPKNDRPLPTEAQKEAGNYKKAHIKVSGLDITIENPVGSTRRGNKMKDNYGYVKRTEGADGDQVDVFVNPKIQENDDSMVYVIDQTTEDGVTFDEHKVMLGYKNQLDAARGYKRNYDKGWKVGPITEMTMEEFKTWLKTDTTVPATPKPSRAARRFVRDKKGKVRYSLREHKKARLADAKESIPGVDAAFVQHVLGQPTDGTLDPAAQKAAERLFETQDAVTPDTTAALRLKGIQEAVAKANKAMPEAKIRVVESYKELSDEAIAFIESKGVKRVRGLYLSESDEIVILAENIKSPDVATRVAMHEATHKGLRRLLGADFVPVMQDIYANLTEKQLAIVDRIGESYGLDMTKEGQRLTATEEFIAKLAEIKPKSTILQRIVAAVRKVLRKAGVVEEWTEADIFALIAEAQGSLARSQPMNEKLITEEVQVEETGEVFILETNAEVALRQHDKRVDVVNKLRACL